MSKKMLINASHHEENRVAIVEDGKLAELDIEIEGREHARGNVYKATVVRVEAGLQAAFVDYGADRLGFLQIGEIHPNLYRKGNGDDKSGRPRINDILKRGQELLVQITREERGSKGAALTTLLSLPGRYMVLMPDSTTKGVSRKIDDEAQRKKLKEAMGTLKIPENMGYIVRTAGIGQKVTELKRDFNYLVSLYKKIQELTKKHKAPAMVYQESDLVIRSIREYFSPDMDEILIDDPEVFQRAQEFFKAIMPSQVKILKQHLERRPIFSRYQVEEQIETITSNKVLLPSGGSIVIDQTEALVAIDINSGRMASEQGIEATAFKSNQEAAAEIGRQLRLRDLGGLIVIDFIDMRDRKNQREVEKTLKNALKNDKARITVGRISQFGLLEMSRQRIRPALAEGSYKTCPTCNGSGRVKSTESQAVAFLRKVHSSCAKGKVEKAEGRVPTDVATYLLNTRREELLELEKRLNLAIEIVGDADFTADQSELNIIKREKGQEEPVGDEPNGKADEKAAGGKNEQRPERRRQRSSGRKPKQSGEHKPAATDVEVTEGKSEEPEKDAAAVAEKPEKSRPRRPRKPRSSGDRKKSGPKPEADDSKPAESKPRRGFDEPIMEPLKKDEKKEEAVPDKPDSPDGETKKKWPWPFNGKEE